MTLTQNFTYIMERINKLSFSPGDRASLVRDLLIIFNKLKERENEKWQS